MTPKCQSDFEEAFLSGYIDRALTQQEQQKVRLHLEGCPTCHSWVTTMKDIRSASLETPFPTLSDQQWNEIPTSPTSSVIRNLGWVIFCSWFLAVLVFGLWEFTRSGAGVWEKSLVFAGFSGTSLLFISVLADRIHHLKTDRYRSVHK